MDALGVPAGWQGLITVIALLAVGYVIAVWVGMTLWTWRDVSRRTADQTTRFTSVGLVALFSLPGWLVYLLMRPQETLEEQTIDHLQQALLSRELASGATCTRCRRRVSDDFLVCPYCREALRVPCRSCERPIALSWEACAYCGAMRARRRADQPEPAAMSGARASVGIRSALAR
jgi:double zinc ribbon protein